MICKLNTPSNMYKSHFFKYVVFPAQVTPYWYHYMCFIFTDTFLIVLAPLTPHPRPLADLRRAGVSFSSPVSWHHGTAPTPPPQ